MRILRRTTVGLAMLVVGTSLLACDGVARAPTGPDVSAASPVLQATTVTSSQRVPFALIAFVPCANNGAGELVEVTGTLHIVDHLTATENGNFHLKIHFQPQGASGIGLTTGDTYRATGVTQEEFNSNGPLPITDTFINNFRIVGQGPDNNLLVHQTIHITVNANGVLTAEVVNASVECR